MLPVDWYLSLVSTKNVARAKNVPGDGIMLPLEFFYHHLGRFMTSKRGGVDVIQRARKYSSAAN